MMATFDKVTTFVLLMLLISLLQVFGQESASVDIIPQATAQLDRVPSLASERSLDVGLEVDPMKESVNHSVDAGRSRSARNRKILLSGCQAHDISITQAQVDTHGIPQFDVQIENTCFDRNCQIFDVVAACGAFSSGGFVNPNVFKRLDVSKGTCLVKDGKSMSSGETLLFSYFENFIQPISLLSARVFCNPK